MEPSAFGYLHRDTFFHRADPRVKLALVIMGGGVIMAAKPLVLGLTGVLIVTTAFWSRLPLAAMMREMRFLAILAFGVALIRAFADPGRVIFSIHELTMTLEGIESGGVMALRLILAAMLGGGICGRHSVESYPGDHPVVFGPHPLCAGKKGRSHGGAFGAVRAHGFQPGTNRGRRPKIPLHRRPYSPVFRLKTFVLAMILRAFQTADQLVVAMEARCFSEDRTRPSFIFASWTWSCWRFPAF